MIASDALARAIVGASRRAQKPGPATLPATYVGRDGQGKGWVLLPGADSPTPVSRMAVEASEGDVLSVTVGNGRVTVDSNISNPSAGVAGVREVGDRAAGAQLTAEAASKDAQAAIGYAKAARTAASDAHMQADAAMASAQSAGAAAQSAISDAATANQAAQSAIEDSARAYRAANSAETAAAEAWEHADEAADAAQAAKSTANSASTYANAALDQLGIVQDVVGVLDWVTEHGRFVRTGDASPQPNKVYYAFDPSAGDYAPVAVPKQEDMALYYELEVDEAIQGFIMKHLAVTNRGLWVVPSGIDAQSEAYLVDDHGNQVVDEDGNPVVAVVNEVQYSSGYKVLLSNDGMYVYDPDGVLVTVFGESIAFSSLRPQYIGNEDAYIAFTPATAQQGASIDIGGQNVTLGSSRKLSDVLADVGTALQPEDVAVSQNPTRTGYDVTIGSNTFSLLDGRGVVSTEISYGKSDSASVQPSASDWSPNPPSALEAGKWLWVRTVNTFTDATTATTYMKSYAGSDGTSMTILGSYATYADLVAAHPTGNTGDSYIVAGDLYVWDAVNAQWSDVGAIQGPPGDSVAVYSIEYGKSADQSTQPSSWGAFPQLGEGDWLWVKTTYTDASETVTKSYVGIDGQRGAQGKSVTSVRTQHYLSTSAQSPQGGSWAYAPQEYVDGRWYWKREEVVWDDDGTTSTTHTDPVIDRALNQAYERIADAEVDINNLDGAVALKANASDVYTKQAANALLEVKANKDTLTSEINASADTVQIDADRVNIAGAALFTSGRLSQSSLDGAYDANGSAATAKSEAISVAASDATSKANAAQAAAESNAKSYADNAVSGKADKTAAVSEEQVIWISKPSGTLSVEPYATWVTTRADLQGAWSLKRPTYAGTHPVVFTAKQRKTVSGDVTCTTPVRDDTTTVIDGGHVTTGTIDANRVNVVNLDGGSIRTGTITIGSMADDVTGKLSEIDDAFGLAYDNTWTLANGVYTFAASARKGGVDITDDLPAEFFTWHLRTEDGTESFLGNGKAMTVQASSAGYHATVVGGLEESVEFAVATSSGDRVVDEHGRRLIGIWKA